MASGRALLLSSHLPLPSLGRFPENTTTACPVPDAPANSPVLFVPSTVSGTVVVKANSHVLADFKPPVFAPELSRTTARLPDFVWNICVAPFCGDPPSGIVAVVLTGPVAVR